MPLPEILDPSKLQDLLAGQDYHMLETEIEAIVLKAKTEARLRQRLLAAEQSGAAKLLMSIDAHLAAKKIKLSSLVDATADAEVQILAPGAQARPAVV